MPDDTTEINMRATDGGFPTEVYASLEEDRVTCPDGRGFSNTWFAQSYDAVAELFQDTAVDAALSLDWPDHEIGSYEPDMVDWHRDRTSDTGELYEAVAADVSEMLGEGRVVHMYETLALSNDQKRLDVTGPDMEQFRLWMYVDGAPHMMVTGFADSATTDAVAERTDPVQDNRWEMRHYLEEGQYLDEAEIIETHVSFGDRVTDIMTAEPDDATVDAITEAYKTYRDDVVLDSYERRGDDWTTRYAKAVPYAQELTYAPEDVRAFAHRHYDPEAGGAPDRLGNFISALVNEGDDEVYVTPGIWAVGTENEKLLFLENEAPWVGHRMTDGRLVVKDTNVQFGFAPEDDTIEHEVEETSYLSDLRVTRTAADDE